MCLKDPHPSEPSLVGRKTVMPTRPTPERHEGGFTLLELLVVIIIIGLLAAIAVPIFLSQRAKGVDASLKADLSSLAKAQESWAVGNPAAPGGTDDLAALRAEGFSASPGNKLMVSRNPTRRGYCLLAFGVGSTVERAGGTELDVMAYDSLGGGLLTGFPAYDRLNGNPNSLSLLPGACGPGRLPVVYVS
jgi:type IV pilus assembly protein PilA